MIAVHRLYRTRAGLDATAAGILEAGQYLVLGTSNDDGSTHLAPVMYRHEGGRLLIETSAATRKVHNVLARGRATALVLDPRADGTSWVSGAGAARVVRGGEAAAIGRRIRSRYLTASGEAAMGTVLAHLDDVAIVVTPDRWLRWDATALLETVAEHGADLATAGDWFLPAAGPA